jgi:cell division protein FtsB
MATRKKKPPRSRGGKKAARTEAMTETIIGRKDDQSAKPIPAPTTKFGVNSANRQLIIYASLGIAVLIIFGLGFYVAFIQLSHPNNTVQISALAARIESLEAKMDTLAERSATVSDLAARIESLEAEMDALAERSATIAAEVPNLNPLIARISSIEGQLESLTKGLDSLASPPASEPTPEETETGWTSFFSDMFRITRIDEEQH